MSEKTALITGITGQDGAYLADLLLTKGYKVYGLVRRISERNFWRLKKLSIEDEIIFLDGDLTETQRLYEIVREYKFDEIYNLGAMSHVGSSFLQPVNTYNVDALPVLHFLEAIKIFSDKTKFYQASTSEMYGNANDNKVVIDEQFPMSPVSPYGASKLFAHNQVRIYRESYGLFAVSGILFNHESPLRGDDFVTKKIVNFAKYFKNSKLNNLKPLQIGNLEAKRDWGYAKEYVAGMFAMMQKDEPEDYVLATGKATSVREFIEETFKNLGYPIIWKGSDEEEIGFIEDIKAIEVSRKFYRPNELHYLRGDAAKAQKKLGWFPKTDVPDLVKLMLE
ncbi:MAG TPA: GDP-mannose 4,6-dehydratase [Candidatus Dojkabacteria bacterium]|jgi:GDPmannose 4,6-dehydratase